MADSSGAVGDEIIAIEVGASARGDEVEVG